jgi:hypothetical protein
LTFFSFRMKHVTPSSLSFSKRFLINLSYWLYLIIYFDKTYCFWKALYIIIYYFNFSVNVIRKRTRMAKSNVYRKLIKTLLLLVKYGVLTVALLYNINLIKVLVAICHWIKYKKIKPQPFVNLLIFYVVHRYRLGRWMNVKKEITSMLLNKFIHPLTYYREW